MPGAILPRAARSPRSLSPPASPILIPRPGLHGSGEPRLRRKDLDPLIFRWKKTTRALKIHDQPLGKRITDVLERCTDQELALFTDPVEAAAYFCLLDVVKQGRPCGSPPPVIPSGIPGQSMLVPDCGTP
jgi:hypothetical protein